MRHSVIKDILTGIILLSAVAKSLDFNNMVLLMNTTFKISFALGNILLVFFIILEVIVSVSIWLEIYNLRLVYYSILFLFISFLSINFLFILFELDNCGCFGTFIRFPPAISLIKSTLLLILFIYLRHKKIDSKYLET